MTGKSAYYFFAIGTFFLGMGLEAFIKEHGNKADRSVEVLSQVILYTTDGTDPFIHGNLCWHDCSMTLDSSAQIKAIGIRLFKSQSPSFSTDPNKWEVQHWPDPSSSAKDAK